MALLVRISELQYAMRGGKSIFTMHDILHTVVCKNVGVQILEPLLDKAADIDSGLYMAQPSLTASPL